MQSSLPESYQLIPIEEFDQLARNKQFTDGPYKDGFGDGLYDPYRPEREVWGKLLDGKKVRSIKHYGA